MRCSENKETEGGMCLEEFVPAFSVKALGSPLGLATVARTVSGTRRTSDGRRDWRTSSGGRDWRTSGGGRDWRTSSGGRDWRTSGGGRDATVAIPSVSVVTVSVIFVVRRRSGGVSGGFSDGLSDLVRLVTPVNIDGLDEARWVGVFHGLSLASLLLDWVVSGKFWESTSNNFVDTAGELAFGCLVEGEDALGSTAVERAIGVARAVVDNLLEDTTCPSIEEVTVVSVATAITMRVDEGLVGPHGLVPFVGEVRSTQVHLHENPRQSYRIFGVFAATLVSAIRRERDVGSVVGRVDILAVPAHREVDLRTNTRGTLLLGQLIVSSGFAVEIQAQKGNGLLGVAVGVVGTKERVSRQHPEVVGESSNTSRFVGVEIVDDGAAIEGGDGSILPLEIEGRNPVK
jgi:hypothetical protein